MHGSFCTTGNGVTSTSITSITSIASIASIGARPCPPCGCFATCGRIVVDRAWVAGAIGRGTCINHTVVAIVGTKINDVSDAVALGVGRSDWRVATTRVWGVATTGSGDNAGCYVGVACATGRAQDVK